MRTALRLSRRTTNVEDGRVRRSVACRREEIAGKISGHFGDTWTWFLPTTSVVIPSNGAVQSGSQYLDAIASPGATQVQYELSGGPQSYTDKVISGSTPSSYGWIGGWDTTVVSAIPVPGVIEFISQGAVRGEAPKKQHLPSRGVIGHRSKGTAWRARGRELPVPRGAFPNPGVIEIAGTSAPVRPTNCG
jgi:hypothetical protein